jgi:hypothetical protein
MPARFLFAFIGALVCSAVLAGQSSKLLTNEDVIQLAKAGLGEEIILKAIATNQPTFDTSVQGLTALKSAGVSDKVIAAVLDRQAQVVPLGSQAPRPAIAPVPQNGTTPVPPLATGAVVLPPPNPVGAGGVATEPWPPELAGMARETGIYYKRANAFVVMYGKPVATTQTAGFAKTVVTAGLSKIRSRGEIPGKRAQLQFPEHQPAFYFYLPEGQTPETFSLIRLEEKGDHRQFEVGSLGGATGSHSSGLKLKSIQQFTIERVASRVYRGHA